MTNEETQNSKTVVLRQVIFWGVAGYLFLLPFAGSGKLLFLYISVLAAIADFTISKRTFVKTPLFGLVICYVSAGIISGLFSDNRMDSLGVSFQNFIKFIIPFFIIANYFDTVQKNIRMLYVLVTSALIVCSAGFFNFFVLGQTNKNGGLYAFGLKHHHSISTYLVFIFPFALALAMVEEKKWIKVLKYTVSIILAEAVFLSNCRGGWVALAAAVLTWVVVSKPASERSLSRNPGFRNTLNRESAVFALCGLVLLSVALVDSSTRQHMAEFLPRIRTLSLRTTVVWPEALKAIRENLFLGVGLDDTFFSNYTKGVASHEHNLILSIMLKTGLLGLSLFCMMMFVFFKRTISSLASTRDKFTRAVLAASVSCVVAELFVHGLIEVTNRGRLGILLWSVMGMSMALVKSENSTAKKGRMV